MKNQGITIIELIIVIIIMGIIGFYGVRLYNSSTNLYGQAYQLASYIRTTQQNAMSMQMPMRILLRSDGYQIYYTDDIANLTTASSNIFYPAGISQCSCSANPGGVCYIKYDSVGMPYSANNSGTFAALGSNFTVTLCVSGMGSGNKIVTINTAGEVIVQ